MIRNVMLILAGRRVWEKTYWMHLHTVLDLFAMAASLLVLSRQFVNYLNRWDQKISLPFFVSINCSSHFSDWSFHGLIQPSCTATNFHLLILASIIILLWRQENMPQISWSKEVGPILPTMTFWEMLFTCLGSLLGDVLDALLSWSSKLIITRSCLIQINLHWHSCE